MFDFEVTERIAVISTGAGYTLELNRVSYNGYPPKLDLRRWKGEHPLKGVTLTAGEAHSLLEALEQMEA